jgi:CO/xanthine dehydrogenase Mo-binding subunit
VIFNAGAYAGFVPVPTLHGGYAEIAGAYCVPNCAIEVLRVYTNTVPCRHMRAPGAQQVAFADESHIDLVAHEMGLDPLEMRQRNAIVDGDLTPLGETRRHLRCRETIEAGARAFGWDKPKPPHIGRGISIYEHPPGNFGRSTVTLTLGADGHFTLMLGHPKQAEVHTIAAQLVAEHFGVSVAEVEIVQGDTLSSGFEAGSSGQRLTTTIGQAIAAAADTMKQDLTALAAERLNCAPADVRLGEDGSFSAAGAMIALRPLMAWGAARGRRLELPGRERARGSRTTARALSPISPKWRSSARPGRRCAYVTALTGTIVNPITHKDRSRATGRRSQPRRADRLKDGAVITAHLGDYKLRRSWTPEKTVLLPVGAAPFATAIGEMSNVALPAAITNAVFDAVGVRLRELPSARKVLEGLSDRAGVA